jgi:hypothetical protein
MSLWQFAILSTQAAPRGIGCQPAVLLFAAPPESRISAAQTRVFADNFL